MNDEDLYEPKLTPPPTSAPLASGAILAAWVTVALASGCNGVAPGVGQDANVIPDAGQDAASPGVRVDAGNPGAP